MKKFVNMHLLTIIGLLAGATAGFFYWQQIGCNSGTCAITSQPVNSTVYGAVMGGLLFSLFQKTDKKDNNKAL